jgi:hypothetical protein
LALLIAPKETVPATFAALLGAVTVTAAEVGAGVGTVVGFGVATMVGEDVAVGVGLIRIAILMLCSARDRSWAEYNRVEMR